VSPECDSSIWGERARAFGLRMAAERNSVFLQPFSDQLCGPREGLDTDARSLCDPDSL
jgi:hypothetical protein